jgi:hypothetical protein
MRLTALVVTLHCIAIVVAPSNASAKPMPLRDARVLWHRAGLLYVVLGDSTMVEPADTLLFDVRGKDVAKASVIDLAEGGLIVARLHSGSLERERRLDRLRVRLERRALPSLSALRVGVPSVRRAAVQFGCGAWALRSPAGATYGIEATGRLSFRMTRDRSGGSSTDSVDAAGLVRASWPDTLLVNLFDDAAEEEIALERGDLDVALFGPGEISSRLRNDARWQNRLFADGGALLDSSADTTATGALSVRRTPFPVLTPPDLLPYVRALGPSEFLRMLDCDERRGVTP